MEAVVLTNDYLPRQGVDISPTLKSLHCDKRHIKGKDPLNFLNFENYRESTPEPRAFGRTISPPGQSPWPGVTRRRQWVSALLMPLIDGRVTINY